MSEFYRSKRVFLVIPMLLDVVDDFLGKLFVRIVWLEEEVWKLLCVSGLTYVRRVLKLIVTFVSHVWLVFLRCRIMPVFCSWSLWFRSRRRADCLSWKSPVQMLSQFRETLVAFRRESVSNIRSIWWEISVGRLEIKSTGGIGAEVTPIATKRFRKNSMVMLCHYREQPPTDAPLEIAASYTADCTFRLVVPANQWSTSVKRESLKHDVWRWPNERLKPHLIYCKRRIVLY